MELVNCWWSRKAVPHLLTVAAKSNEMNVNLMFLADRKECEMIDVLRCVDSHPAVRWVFGVIRVLRFALPIGVGSSRWNLLDRAPSLSDVLDSFGESAFPARPLSQRPRPPVLFNALRVHCGLLRQSPPNARDERSRRAHASQRC